MKLQYINTYRSQSKFKNDTHKKINTIFNFDFAKDKRYDFSRVGNKGDLF